MAGTSRPSNYHTAHWTLGSDSRAVTQVTGRRDPRHVCVNGKRQEIFDELEDEIEVRSMRKCTEVAIPSKERNTSVDTALGN